MIKGKQIAVIGLVVVLMGLLLSLNIKGLKKGEEGQHSGEAAEKASQLPMVSVESVSTTAKQALNANLSDQISSLESSIKSAGEPERFSLLKQIAQKWDDVNQPAPSAFYNEQIAEKENTLSAWLKTGDLFSSAYSSTKDTLIQPALVAKALVSYQKALDLNPKSLDAKTGLGVAYVSGTPEPMKGITLLLEVVKEDPKNVKANLNLGLFSIKSGQFDKGVIRFKNVLEKQQLPDAWFYLATCYENLGQKKEAIQAYETSKTLAADPGFSTYIDQRIQTLKK
ncbi:tetratricopeptide repeat protein [Arcticibacter eurypsychrophilus]|uniref:tetratricopeptide repeat protein n=1 Tax=Arcticibacter eurypsychrophilus TaxID=1434752 RepID=UPI00084D2104|nr:tetratricopeptide repeat protein [Arcticibacter eurypsychrophilus]